MRIPRVSIAVLMGLVGLVAVDLALVAFCLGVDRIGPAFLAALEFLGMGNLLTLAWFRYLGQPGRHVRAFLLTGTAIALASLATITSMAGWVAVPFTWLAFYWIERVEPYYSGSPHKDSIEAAAGVAFIALSSALIALPQVCFASASWFHSRYKIVRRADPIEQGEAG